MNVKAHWKELRGAGLVALGAGGLSWIARLPNGALAATEISIATPAIVFGVCLVLAPALYIGLCLSGAKTEPRAFADAMIAGWRAAGLTALGFAAPLLFLVATTSDPNVALALGALALSVSLFVGLLALFRDSAEHSAASFVCFVLWSLAAFSVGAKFFFEVVR